MPPITEQSSDTLSERYLIDHLNHGIITARQFNCVAGDFIRQKRLALGLTGKGFGRLLNMSQQQISRYERGNTSMTLHQLDQMFRLLGVSWKTFVDEVVQPVYLKSSLPLTSADVIADIFAGHSDVIS